MDRRIAVGALLFFALVAAGFSAVLAPRFGYATPFGVPASVSYHGRDYVDPACVSERDVRRQGSLPLRRAGSVPGFLTGAKALFAPHVRRGVLPTPVVVYVQAGCLEAYGLSGGP